MEAKAENHDPTIAAIRAAVPTQPAIIQQWLKRRNPHRKCAKLFLYLQEIGGEPQAFPPWQSLPPTL